MPGTAPTPTAATNGGNLPLSDGDPSNAGRDREVENRVHLFQESFRGFAHGGALPRYFSVDAGGTGTAFTVRVAAFPELLMRRAGTGVVATSVARHQASGELVAGVALVSSSLTFVEGSVAALTASKWYAVYAASDGAGGLVPTIARMDTASPDATWPWRDINRVQRYCGCFLTDVGGSPLQLRAANGHYTFPRWYDGAANFTYGPASASGTALFTIPNLPPTARNVRLSVSSATNAGVSEETQTGAYLALAAGQVIDLVTNGAQQVLMHALAVGGTATFSVMDFEEG